MIPVLAVYSSLITACILQKAATLLEDYPGLSRYEAFRILESNFFIRPLELALHIAKSPERTRRLEINRGLLNDNLEIVICSRQRV